MTSSEVNFQIQDEGRLAELGYTQELTREWSLLHNFGVSFSIIVRESSFFFFYPAGDPNTLMPSVPSAECGHRYHYVCVKKSTTTS